MSSKSDYYLTLEDAAEQRSPLAFPCWQTFWPDFARFTATFTLRPAKFPVAQLRHKQLKRAAQRKQFMWSHTFTLVLVQAPTQLAFGLVQMICNSNWVITTYYFDYLIWFSSDGLITQCQWTWWIQTAGLWTWNKAWMMTSLSVRSLWQLSSCNKMFYFFVFSS